MAEMPQSQALAEASVDSLSELFSRDPEGLSKLDRSKMIEAYRAQRGRWADAERLATANGGKKPGAMKAKNLVAGGSAEDSGL